MLKRSTRFPRKVPFMNPQTSPKNLIYFAVTFFLAAISVNQAHAKNVILTGDIDAQYLCHDGANRGASIKLYLSRTAEFDEEKRGANSLIGHFYTGSPKHYYAATTCMDLGLYITEETLVHVFTSYDVGFFPSHFPDNYCQDFRIRYVRNGETVWVQNGGTTIWNITCVAKDDI